LKSEKGKKYEHHLTHFQRTNSFSAYSQRPVVALGQKVKEGDLVVLAAFGSGFTWGSAIIRW